MSDLAVTSGATFNGIAKICEVVDPGMITFRGDLADPAVAVALREAMGCDLPGQRGLVQAGDRAIGWMSPDEMLLVLPHAGVAGVLAALGARLEGRHHLALDVSDARAVFRIEGPHAREVLAKIAPVDLAPHAFGPGELRRTRAAQVAAAFWMDGADAAGGEAFTLVCFRSVGRYVYDLLCAAAAPGSEVGAF